MKFPLKYILLFFCFSVFSGTAQVRVLTIGDSTMADYDILKNSEEKEKRGWGQMLPLFFNDSVQIDNAARNGRSTKSFYFEFWETGLRETLKPGDYVIIQFGHNDEKNNGSDTDESDPKERGTAPWSQYRKYLRKYITESHERGAVPILVTPVVRRMFNEDGKTLSERGKHNLVEYSDVKSDSVLNYVLAMKAVAREMSVPLVDMTESTGQLVTEYGPDKSKERIYCDEDNTHLRTLGGILFAELFAKDLVRQNILKEYIVFSKEAVFPESLDFGPRLTGIPALKAISVVSIGIPGKKDIKIETKLPYQLSFYPDKEFSEHLTSSADGDFNGTVYVRFIPPTAKEYTGNISFRSDWRQPIIVPLSGTGITANKENTVEARVLFAGGNMACIVNGNISANIKPEGLTLTEKGFIPTDKSWAAQEIDINSSRYIELSIDAKEDIYINHISFDMQAIGSEKMQFTALGSASVDFTKTDTFSVMETVSDKKVKSYLFETMVQLPKDKTYTLRIYPWDKSGGDNKYLLLDNITVKGLGIK